MNLFLFIVQQTQKMFVYTHLELYHVCVRDQYAVNKLVGHCICMIIHPYVYSRTQESKGHLIVSVPAKNIRCDMQAMT